MANKEFDGKQKKKSNIILQMVLIFAVLIFANACLMCIRIKWANGYDSFLIILLFTFAFGLVERVKKGIYVYNNSKLQVFIEIIIDAFVIIATVLIAIEIANGEKIVVDGSLTKSGGGLITMALILFMQIVPIIKILSDKSQNKKHEKKADL